MGVGILGLFLVTKHVLLSLMAIEVIFLAINLNFIAGSVFLDDMYGQVYSLSLLTVAAAEAAIGLALVVSFFKLNGSIAIDSISKVTTPVYKS